MVINYTHILYFKVENNLRGWDHLSLIVDSLQALWWDITIGAIDKKSKKNLEFNFRLITASKKIKWHTYLCNY